MVFAGSALADGKSKLSGQVDGDSAASVSLAVVKKSGAPKSVKNVRIKNLLADCGSREARIELNLSGAAKLNSKRKFEMVYKNEDGKVKLQGKVKADASRVKGEISGSTIKIAGAGKCDVPNASFVVKD